MAQQIPLIPVSAKDREHAAYRLMELMDQDEEEDESFDEAKQAHKETKAVLKKAMAEQRAILRRAKLEAQQGSETQRQVDALIAQAEEERA